MGDLKMVSNALVKAENVSKIYQTGKTDVHALRNITLNIEAGDFAAIVGPSGSGKTTLLNLIGALDIASEGTLTVIDSNISEMSKRLRADMRLHNLGFVFQAYNLVPVLTARENVEFVLELQGVGDQRTELAMKALDQLGLADLADRRPNELSGGQQQRVAVARAIASSPKLVLADEPTANLDGENAEILLKMMRELNRNQGITFIFSTHDPRVVTYAKRVITLEDGCITEDINKNSTAANE